ncbi:Vegetative incompatibility HET-E-1-like protein [Cladobotryum mycophilum]|uniref:Vegetative incompatibility HET-E-1-like protein n=1 Tax=Cladobotryum mycophilum TaxID=491253 RepID=A0ABR0S8J2_9HYPO
MSVSDVFTDLPGPNLDVLQVTYGLVIVSICLLAGWGCRFRPRTSNSRHRSLSHHDSPPPAERPIHVLHEDENAALDIIAVHGLAANPDYAWIWLPKNNPPGIPGYPEKHFNWLKDLLPTKLASSNIPSRIMTFNYDSNWFLDAPKQRLSNISDSLLASLRNKRVEANARPLIFIGHSFGGNLIEQTILSASRHESGFTDIAASTVGVIFLGTPHRGSAAASWGSLLASHAPSHLGFEDRILKDLEEQSGTLIDRLHDFSRWLFSESVPVICYFEKRVTDYSSRVGPMGKALPLKDLVVPETSACIDGHRKMALDTDHFKINKFYGKDDPSFKMIYPEIECMARNATDMLNRRRLPNVIPTDERNTSGKLQQCLQQMRVSNPRDVLMHIQNQKGERLENSCEWILKREEFTKWGASSGPRLLRLIGPPALERRHYLRFLWRSFTARLKDHLLLQNSNLFRHIESDFKRHSGSRLFEDLFDNSFALLRIFQDMIQDDEAGEVFILLDALDECDKSTRSDFLSSMARLFKSSQGSKGKLKVLITCRPEIGDIEDAFSGMGVSLRIDAANINDDLSLFIDKKVSALAKRKNYNKALKTKVRYALKKGSGGTFLWVSLMVADLARPGILMHQVQEKLRNLPHGLDQVYASILDRIEPSHQGIAKFILHCMVASREPLSKREIQSAFATSFPAEGSTAFPNVEDLQVYDDILSACSSIVNTVDSEYREPRLHFCHQSVKDFLLIDDSKSGQKWYHTTLDAAHLHMFHACWNYLNADNGKLYNKLFFEKEDEDGMIRLHQDSSANPLTAHPFTVYAYVWWKEHITSSCPAVLHELAIDLPKTPIMRDLSMIRAAEKNNKAMVQFLISCGGNINARDNKGATSLTYAIKNGNRDVVQVLLATGKVDVKLKWHDETLLIMVIQRKWKNIVQMLLKMEGVDLHLRDWNGMTALHWATRDGLKEIIQMLAATGNIDWNVKDKFGQTALDLAFSTGDKDIVQWILETENVDINSANVVGNPPLNWFINRGDKIMVQYLLTREDLDETRIWCNRWLQEGVDINLQDKYGQSPVTWAVANEDKDILQMLLATDKADLDSKDELGETLRALAVRMGNEDILQMLVTQGKSNTVEEGTN